MISLTYLINSFINDSKYKKSLDQPSIFVMGFLYLQVLPSDHVFLAKKFTFENFIIVCVKIFQVRTILSILDIFDAYVVICVKKKRTFVQFFKSGGVRETRTLAPVARPTSLAGTPLHQLGYYSKKGCK